ncbi:uncharacterized protein LOC125178135 [Hyalella azteca]|uniref:Ataxin-10 n=1 Tax=Hyalella azteca TaxID=294128 RepID=A0A979FKW7_HYAAZ|nr:uncharacterized protein LOC125178135 [Hyalella azteca]
MNMYSSEEAILQNFTSLEACLKQHALSENNISCCCKIILDKIRLSICGMEDQGLQDLVWSSTECVETLKKCMKQVFHLPNASPELLKLNEHEEEVANAFVMCIANLCAGNSNAITKLCNAFTFSSIYDVFLSMPVHVGQKWCAVIFSILLQKSLCQSFLETLPLAQAVAKFCNVYSVETQHACFALFCLEIIFCQFCDLKSFRVIWFEHLNDTQKLLVLSICQNIIVSGTSHKRGAVASVPMIEFLSKTYLDAVGVILSNDAGQIEGSNPLVLRELCAAVLGAAASPLHCKILKSQASLLLITVSFLKALNIATFQPDNEASKEHFTSRWSQLQLVNADAGVGLRCDLVQLLGNLVNEDAQNQDELRAVGGLEEIFCSCRRDEANPLIQEAVIFALGCCLKNNPQNALHLKEQLATRHDGQDSALMERLGLKADQFVQVPTNEAT